MLVIVLLISGCSSEAEETAQKISKVNEEKSTMTTVNKENLIQIQIGNKNFDAVLENNPTVEVFLKKLPLDIELEELNGNEKYYHFNEKFPTNDSIPEMIHAGDLMLFNGSYFVMFYKDFSTSYSYTRLGKIKNPDGLNDAVGSGKIKITIKS